MATTLTLIIAGDGHSNEMPQSNALRAQPCATLLTLGVLVAVAFFGVSGRLAAAGKRLSCVVPANVMIDNVAALPQRVRARVFANWRKAFLINPTFESDWGGGRGSYLVPSQGLPLVIMPAGRGLSGSPRDWLFAYERTFFGRKRPVSIESVRVNHSPRRIIFVAENGTGMTPEARQIESAVIADILSKARPEDTFALLTAGGPHIALPFGSHRSELLAAAKELAKVRPSTSESEGVRHALLEATKWFRGHQPGDAVFAFTMALEGKPPGFLGSLRIVSTFGLAQKREASFKQVRRAVLRHHIRVFGFQLGHTSYNPPACPVSMCGITVRPNQSNGATYFGSGAAARLELLDLCATSFGLFANTDTEREGYKLTASRLARMESYAETMYQSASEYYVLGLSSTSKGLVIRLKPNVENQFPWSYVFYPPDIPSCSSR